jgi:diguanylate cyclase (GGDEF)-like protein
VPNAPTSFGGGGTAGAATGGGGAGGGGAAGRSATGAGGTSGGGTTAATFGALSPTTALVPARGAAGDTARANQQGHHRGSGSDGFHLDVPGLSPASTVIERFVGVIPAGVWAALGGLLLLAAAAAATALRSHRRASFQAGQMAAVSAAALTDPLTGVLNRRGFTEAVERELARARRYHRPFVLAYVDVRGLKRVNDTQGHLAGDELLKAVAGLLHDSARADDVVGRIGGDELALLLAEQSAAGAATVTRRIESKVPAKRAEIGLRAPWDLTIGAAAFPDDGDTLEELLAVADRRLYEQRGISLHEPAS